MAAKTTKKAKPVKKKKPTKAALQKIAQAKRISDRHDKASKVVDLIEKGKSLRFALIKFSMSAETFYQWRAHLTDEELQENGEQENDGMSGANAKRYAHACEERERNIFEEMLDIADDCTGDKKEFVNNRGKIVTVEDKEYTSRSKLKIETRQWVLGKMRPEKYGNNVQVKVEEDITISFKG